MRMRATFAGLALALAASACQQPAIAAEATVNAPQAERVAKESGLKTAIFAGGCFWGVEQTALLSGQRDGVEKPGSFQNGRKFPCDELPSPPITGKSRISVVKD